MARKNKQSAAQIAAQSQMSEDQQIQQAFEQGITTLRDLISPSSIEIKSDYFRLGTKYGRTLYIYGYPRSLYTGWLSPLINIDEVLDISMYIYPVEKRSGNLPRIAHPVAFRAGASFFGIPVIPASAGIHRSHKHKFRRIAYL